MKKNFLIFLICITIIISLFIIICYKVLYKSEKNTAYIKTEKYNHSSYNNPIVPNGFKKVETKTASWELEKGIPKGWNNGLVIEDEIGNQFVWIPVPERNGEQDYKYGGFYVARYEAGVSENMQQVFSNIDDESNDVIGIPVSKKNVRPWNYISYEKASENAKSMYNSEDVKSSLLTLEKMKIIIEWLSNCGYDVYNDSSSWGNYSNSAFYITGLYSNDAGKNYQYANNVLKDDNMIVSSGATDRNMANNIYDFAGNLWEYTNTQYEDTKYHYSVGGYYGTPGNYRAASTKNAFSCDPVGTTGFRVCLNLL